ncbi:MAG TPA: hypothetical protein VHT74_14535 [Acetobacteraceae bacterium]|nr:hypothetical protein [Acetobacteraceae bacterium]
MLIPTNVQEGVDWLISGFGEGDEEEEEESGDVAIEGAPGERNGRDGHDPTREDDESTALPDDDEP